MSVSTFSTRLDDRSARLSARVHSRLLARAARTDLPSDAGMSTAEYAVGTVAACGFAGLLIKLLTDSHLKTFLFDLITHAIKKWLPF